MMRNAFVAAVVAVICLVAATDQAQAADIQQARKLLEQKKYEEAYALLEKETGTRSPSADVLAVGMEAAVGSGRIVVGSRLARQLVRQGLQGKPAMLYRCAEIAILAGQNNEALARFRTFIQEQGASKEQMKRAIGFVLRHGNFPDAYAKAIEVFGTGDRHLWEQGLRILQNLLADEDRRRGLELAGHMLKRYGQQPKRANGIMDLLYNHRRLFTSDEDRKQLLTLLVGTRVSNEGLMRGIYEHAGETVSLKERLQILFQLHGKRTMRTNDLLHKFGDMRLLKSEDDRQACGTQYLALEALYAKQDAPEPYLHYLNVVAQHTNVFAMQNRVLVKPEQASAMIDRYVAKHQDGFSHDLFNRFVANYIRKDPKLEEKLLRTHLKCLSPDLFGRLVELTKGEGLDGLLADYTGGTYGRTVATHTRLLQVYERIKRKDLFLEAARLMLSTHPHDFDERQIRDTFSRRGLCSMEEKSGLILEVIKKCGVSPRLAKIVTDLARRKDWADDAGIQKARQAAQGMRKGNDPLLSALAKLATSKKRKPAAGDDTDKIVDAFLAAYDGTLPGDTADAANEKEYVACSVMRAHVDRLRNNRPQVCQWGERWGPRIRELGPNWSYLVHRVSDARGGSRGGSLWRLTPHFVKLLDQGGKVDRSTFDRFTGNIHPAKDSSTPFAKHYGKMGLAAWNYVLNQRETWPAKVFYSQVEAAAAAITGGIPRNEIERAINEIERRNSHSKPSPSLVKSLYNRYVSMEEADGVFNVWVERQLCRMYASAADRKDVDSFIDAHLKRLAKRTPMERANALTSILADESILDDKGRDRLLNETYASLISGLKPEDWRGVWIDRELVERLWKARAANPKANTVLDRMLTGVIHGASAVRDTHALTPQMIALKLRPAIEQKQWEDTLRVLDGYVRMSRHEHNWQGFRKRIEEALEILEPTGKPEIAYALVEMALARADRYEGNQANTEMRALHSRVAKNVPGLVPVDKKHPTYSLHIAARALVEGDIERAWELTQPRLTILRKEWPTLDGAFVAWTVEQMRKQRMLKEARDFCFEILLKESELTPADAAAVILTKGDTYRDMQNYEASRIEYQSLRDNKRYAGTPAGQRARARLIELLITTGEFATAEMHLARLVDTGSLSDQAEAYYLYARSAYEQKDYVQSRDHLAEVFRRVSDHVEARLLEGELRLKLPRGLATTEVLLGRLDLQTVVVPGRELTLKLSDTNLSIAQGGKSIPIVITTTVGGDKERVRLTVSPDDSTLFRGTIQTTLGKAAPGNLRVEVCGKDHVSYVIDPEYQKANKIDYPPKLLEVKSDARLIASSGEFLSKEEEEKRKVERAMLMAEGRLSARDRMARNTVVRPGSPIHVQVTDLDRDLSDERDTVNVVIKTTSGDVLDPYPLVETEPHSGIFQAAVKTGVPLPLATASDAQEGSDPNAVLNSTKNTSWLSQADQTKPKWLEVDTMSSHAVKEITVSTPDVERIKRMRFVGMLGVKPLLLGLYPSDDKAGIDGVTIEYNNKNCQPSAKQIRYALKTATTTYRASAPTYNRADTPFGAKNTGVNTRMRGAFWVDEEDNVTFRFMQPESPKRHQTAYLFIDGKLLMGGTMDSRSLERTASAYLSAGPHLMEVLVRDNHQGSQVIVGTKQPDGTFKPMSSDAFSAKARPGLKSFISSRGKVTRTENGFKLTLDQPVRLRGVRCVFEDFTGAGLAVREVSITDADGKVVLPVKQDFTMGLKNKNLEIAAGDSINIDYHDEKRLDAKNPTLNAQLGALFFDAEVSLLFEDIVKTEKGTSISHPAAQRVRIGDQLLIKVTDFDLDLTDKRDTIPLMVSTTSGSRLELKALEGLPGMDEQSSIHAGVFTQTLKIGTQTGPNTIAAREGDTISVEYLDEENSSPGIPTPRTAQIALAPNDTPVISVLPTWVERVEDKSQGAAARVKMLQKRGHKDAKLETDRVVAEPAPAGNEAVNASVQAPILFTVRFKKMALHAESKYHVYVQTESGTKAAKDGKPAELKTPIRLTRLSQLASSKGYPVRFQDYRDVADPLRSGVFAGIVRLQLGAAGDTADSYLRGDSSFTAGPVDVEDGPEDLLGPDRIPTVVANGSDKITIIVRDDKNVELARRTVNVMSDARLELTDRSYSVDNTSIHMGQQFFVRVTDPDRDTSPELDKVTVNVKSSTDTVELTLTETLPHSGVFTAAVEPHAGPKKNDGGGGTARLAAKLGDKLTFTYADPTPLRAKPPAQIVAEGLIHKGDNGSLVSFTKRFTDPDMAVKTRFLMAEAMFEMAKHHRKIGQKDVADKEIASGKRILEEAMRDYPDTKHVAQGEYLLANLSQELKRYDEAIGRYSNIIGSWPDSEFAVKSQLKKAICYEKMGQHDPAAEEYVRLTYLYADSSLVADATIRLANLYYRDKNFEVAGRIFRRFQARHPDHKLASKSLFLSGQCFIKEEMWEDAAETFKTVVDTYLQERDVRAEAMYWMADCYHKAKDYPEAYKGFKRLTWDYPESKWAKIARGRLTEEEMVEYEESTLGKEEEE